MIAIKLAAWGFSVCEARYYGYRYALHLGPWLVFVFPRAPEAAE